jgi:hypothetical protein
VVHRGSAGEITWLYPTGRGQSMPNDASLVAIPSSDSWMRLDDRVGTERFFVVASPQPIVRLEALFTLYDTANEGLRRQLAADFEGEIVRLRKELQPLETPAERPAVIGGLVRGMKSPRDDVEVTEVAAEGFFLKVLTIEHR